ncbi:MULTISPECIES: hypothetical protein [Burkholderia]|uniref:hypothetical protein n=1 Tax=Burkholderia TaxID=32008 RepID=UPI0011B1E2FC|nr:MULTISPECIES: hypothetical protein [Burkholderia]MCM2537972.1 hypothetical protein [Burkholderia glumae]QTP32599.1 hypothetical protein B7759_01172 [Burkholderia glumae]
MAQEQVSHAELLHKFDVAQGRYDIEVEELRKIIDQLKAGIELKLNAGGMVILWGEDDLAVYGNASDSEASSMPVKEGPSIKCNVQIVLGKVRVDIPIHARATGSGLFLSLGLNRFWDGKTTPGDHATVQAVIDELKSSADQWRRRKADEFTVTL